MAHVQNICSASNSASTDGASSSTTSSTAVAGWVFGAQTKLSSYLDKLWPQVDRAKPVPEVRVAVQGLGPLRLGHFLLALQLLTDVFHQLYLQGATEAKRGRWVAGQESHNTTQPDCGLLPHRLVHWRSSFWAKTLLHWKGREKGMDRWRAVTDWQIDWYYIKPDKYKIQRQLCIANKHTATYYNKDRQ